MTVKWARRGLIALSLLVLCAINFSQSEASIQYGTLDLEKHTEVGRVRVLWDGVVVRESLMNRRGATLDFHVTENEILMSWALFLPVCQQGIIKGRLQYEALMGNRVVGRSSVSCETRVTRIGLLPVISRKEEMKQQLAGALVKTAKSRLDASRRR